MVVWKLISVWQAIAIYFCCAPLHPSAHENLSGTCVCSPLLFTIGKIYYWQAQMSLWGTGDTKNLVAVITVVIGHKISSYQFIKWHRVTLKYYSLTKQIWSVKSQFLNNFYAEMPLWSCRIFCKTAMEASILKYTQFPHLKLHARNAYISHSIFVYLDFSAEKDKVLRKEICG